MKTIHNLLAIALLATFSVAAQQHSIVQTSLSAAITSTQTKFNVASATGINAPSFASGTAGSSLYVVDIGQTFGELMQVTGISSTTVTVSRTTGPGTAHASGAMVLVATAPNWFFTTNPSGTCTTATVYSSPYVNVATGQKWICSAKTGTWTPSWGNLSSLPQVLSATATASAAGATAIAGPLLEISGTNAITSFTMSTGWNGEGFCVFPTGAFTGTATNNIAKAFTAVANRTLCFTYDANASTAGFSPSY